MEVFFDEGDDRVCIEPMSASCRKRGVEVRAHCLMPNHVRLIAAPGWGDGLRRAVGDAPRRGSC